MKKRKSNFKNQVISDVKRQKRQASSYYLNLPKGVKMFTMKEKTPEMLLDFLPYKVTNPKHPDCNEDEGRAVLGESWYKCPFKVHKNVGVDNNTFVCLTSIGERCPICEFVAKKRKDGEDWKNLVNTASKDRDLYAIIPIDSEDHDDIIHVWDMSYFLFQEELNERIEEDEENAVFPNLEDGKTLLVKFRWKKFKKLYPTTRDIIFKNRKEQYEESILKEVPNLDELLDILSYKELESKFYETEDEPEADATVDYTEDEDTPKSTKMHRKTKVIKEPETEKEGFVARGSQSEEVDVEVGGASISDRVFNKEKKQESTRTRTRRKTETVMNKNKCPHDHTFGKDCEKYDICEECDEWDECDEEKNKS